MYNLSYHVVIRTPIGVRIGDVALTIEDGKVSGVLETPCFEPQFEGCLHPDDTMELTVHVKENGTVFDCQSTGRISGYAIHISVPTESFCYEIDGTVTRAKTNN